MPGPIDGRARGSGRGNPGLTLAAESVEYSNGLPTIDNETRRLMTQFPSRLAASSLVPFLALTAVPVAADPLGLPSAAARKVDYAKDVQPILANNCYSCHGEKKQQSGFR